MTRAICARCTRTSSEPDIAHNSRVNARLFRWLWTTAALLVGLAVLLAAVVYVMSWRRLTRVHAVAIIVPLGLAMGMPFPQGLQRTGRGALPSPPFYWGLNGITSVISSIGTVITAVLFGFQVAMLAGGACYLLAAAASGAMTQEPA